MYRVFRDALLSFLNSRGIQVRRINRATTLPLVDYRGVSRLLYLSRMLDRVRDVEGDIVECGIGYGFSFVCFGLLTRAEMKGRKLWGFDSFQGLPEPGPEDQCERPYVFQGGRWGPPGGWRGATVGTTLTLLRDAGLDEEFIRSQITIIKGFFKETLHTYTGSSIALLHVDADLYSSCMTVLNEFYPKVARGGVVLFDEYMGTIENMGMPGEFKAVNEYLEADHQQISRDPVTGKYFLVKP